MTCDFIVTYNVLRKLRIELVVEDVCMKKKNVKGKDEWIDYISLIIALLIIIGVFLLVRVFDKSKPKGEYVGVSAD